ncbi:1-acyl-sn-glycerol-3-phosphate acyltransferase [Cerasibacillus terrae]|uniref:1-acyl-sn-glycerol-3-phosphate acyltransferase n=1 Tax=Cerasibacillus terrae TaxID=2498845 RepID=A0A5C8NXI3_9BACI|nr:lysophospholipid acyltransferase family protein [Cerasibacillus terrae]TXL65819.1 1-acyl-sn-glycerol-3-phosphate acyltransferase [Cerasibacillus terrae]
MIRTIGIYLYAAILVIGSIFKLQKAKKLSSKANQPEIQKEIFQTPSVVSQKVIKKTGTKIYVNGKENIPDGPALYVANHQGLFDILALLGYLGKPVGFIAKKEIDKLPIIPKWMELLACVFIDRSDRRQSVRAIQKGTKNIKNGHSIVIFPEGTRSKDGQVSSFKAGSFRLGTKAKVPIVPIAIDGTREMYEENNNRVKPSVIQLVVGKPITPEEYEGMKGKELAAYTEKKVSQQLEQIRKTNTN